MEQKHFLLTFCFRIRRLLHKVFDEKVDFDVFCFSFSQFSIFFAHFLFN